MREEVPLIPGIDILIRQVHMGDGVLIAAVLLLLTAPLVGLVAGRLSQRMRPWARRYARFAWQIGTVLGLEQAYEFTRGRIPHEPDVAFLNAYRLLDLEWRHGWFVEERVQRFFLPHGTFMNLVDLFYVVCHVAVTIGVLIWIYTRRSAHYPFMRNMLMVTTGIALIAFYLYPTAPPRLLWNYGFVDPLQLHHFVDAGGTQPGSYTYNPYAAMPSLHVAYALVAAWSLWRSERLLIVRAATVLYPVAMGAVVIISGNHWVLDVVGAALTVGVAGMMVLCASRLLSALPLPRKWET